MQGDLSFTRRVSTIDIKQLRATLGSQVHLPGLTTDALQILKAVVAAVVAWVIAHHLLGLEAAFLAPWTALLTVHATVHRTVWRGGQTVIATVAGIFLAAGVTFVFGVSPWSLGLSLLLGMLLARISVLREEGLTVATTALFLITASYGVGQDPALLDRLADTAIGVVVALIVNVVVIPPLNTRSARQQVDNVNRSLGSLLNDMSHQMRVPWESQDTEDWIERSRDIDRDLQQAWSLVKLSSESGRWNFRTRRQPTGGDDLAEILKRLEEGVAQTRSISRQVRESSRQAQQWDSIFSDRFVDLLARLGEAIADPDANVKALRSDVNSLADDLSREDLPGMMWPLCGSLIASMRIIIDVVDDVATANPVRA